MMPPINNEFFFSIDNSIRYDTNKRLGHYEVQEINLLKHKYDLMNHDEYLEKKFIKAEQFIYDIFFVERLKRLPINEINKFLDYHYNQYSGDKDQFLEHLEYGIFATHRSNMYNEFLDNEVVYEMGMNWIIKKQEEINVESQDLNSKGPFGPQQVLAFHYLQKVGLFVPKTRDISPMARFINFFIDKNTRNIRKYLTEIDDQKSKANLIVVKKLFEDLLKNLENSDEKNKVYTAIQAIDVDLKKHIK